MSTAALGQVALGYQLIWNALRQVAGVQLFIASMTANGSIHRRCFRPSRRRLAEGCAPIATLTHLLSYWVTFSPLANGAGIEVQDTHAHEPYVIERVQSPSTGQLRRGEPGSWPSTARWRPACSTHRDPDA